MRMLRFLPSCILSTSLFLPCSGIRPFTDPVQVPVRDPQAISIAERAVAVMGSSIPPDSSARGSVTIVAGSLTETGSVKILTRSVDQSVEKVESPSFHIEQIYSRGLAQSEWNSSPRSLPLELAVTTQCPDFPLPLLAGSVNNTDFSFQYLGEESLGSARTYHIRFWNTFRSNPKLTQLAGFSERDIWIESGSGLPLKLSYVQREATGPGPSTSVEVFYSDFRNVGGALYPFSFSKSINGTQWATFAIQQVQLNIGLTDENFQLD